MRDQNVFRPHLHAALGSLFILLAGTGGIGCGKKSNTPGKTSLAPDGTDTATTTAVEGDPTTVSMSGSFTLTSHVQGAAVASAYEVRCVTLDDKPQTCSFPVSGALAKRVAFAAECPGLAGTTFSCLLRADSKPRSMIGFDAGDGLLLAAGSGITTTLTTNAGTLIWDAIHNIASGVTVARIDLEKSTALGGDGGGAPTTLDLTGAWTFKCDESASMSGDFRCDPADTRLNQGYDVYVHQDPTAGKVSVWSSREDRQRCFADAAASESSPPLAISLDGKSLPIDPATPATFAAGVDAVFAAMPASLKAEVLKTARARLDLAWCEALEKTLTADTCRLQPFAVESITYTDAETGETVTHQYPTYPANWTAVQDQGDYAGGITTKSVACGDGSVPGVPMCPPGASGNQFTVYTTDDGRDLYLACLDGSGDGTEIRTFPAGGATRAAAITAALGSGRTAAQCATATAYAGIAGLRQGHIEEIRTATAELTQDLDTEPFCDGLEVAAGFSFSDCTGAAADPGVCSLVVETGGVKPYFLTGWRLKVVGGKLVSAGVFGASPEDLPYVTAGEAAFLCPETAKTAHGAWLKSDGSYDFAYKTACRSEFLTLATAVLQGQTLRDMMLHLWPLGHRLLCTLPAADPDRQLVVAMRRDSCMGDIEYKSECQGDACGNLLRCAWSSADGACLDPSGAYAGTLPGRLHHLDLRLNRGNSFGMNERARTLSEVWDQKRRAETACESAWTASFNALKKSDDEFVAVLARSMTNTCAQITDDEAAAAADLTAVPLRATRK